MTRMIFTYKVSLAMHNIYVASSGPKHLPHAIYQTFGLKRYNHNLCYNQANVIFTTVGSLLVTDQILPRFELAEATSRSDTMQESKEQKIVTEGKVAILEQFLSH